MTTSHLGGEYILSIGLLFQFGELRDSAQPAYNHLHKAAPLSKQIFKHERFFQRRYLAQFTTAARAKSFGYQSDKSKMPPKQAAFLNNSSSENFHAGELVSWNYGKSNLTGISEEEIPDKNLIVQNIIKKIYEEFNLVQTQYYETKVLLQTQTQRLTRHIEAVEQQNWNLQRSVWRLESELASERQKGAENAEWKQD